MRAMNFTDPVQSGDDAARERKAIVFALSRCLRLCLWLSGYAVIPRAMNFTGPVQHRALAAWERNAVVSALTRCLRLFGYAVIPVEPSPEEARQLERASRRYFAQQFVRDWQQQHQQQQ